MRMKVSDMKSTFCIVSLVTLALMPAQADESTRVFPHPDRIRFDSQCFTIDGKDVFLYSGEFHYFRCPKPLWRERFQTIKNAGFNCVDTYVPWNLHEREMPSGLDDFSKVDLTDLEDWMNMAEEFGFNTIIRPGPYICAEWDAGGFPQWLLTKKPDDYTGRLWLRSDEPTFLAWSRHWIEAVCPVVVPHQITNKQPGELGVIMFQVENEYDYMGNAGNVFSDQVKINHLKTLAEASRAGGIDVPLVTCWTKQVRGSSDPVVSQIFDTCNFYTRWDVEGWLDKHLPKLHREQPDAPLMVMEMQGGWFSGVGGKLSEEQEGVDAKQINNLTLYAFQHGLTALNYYMLFGGTNLENMGGRDMTSSYDYNAPIREWGGVGDRYQCVRAIGLMLQEHGENLARTEAEPCDVETSQDDVQVAIRRAKDGSRYLFVRTPQHTESREGSAKVKVGDTVIPFDYELGPFGSKILYLPTGVTDPDRGEWLPKPAPPIERPADLPPAVEITSAQRRSDPGPSKWTRVPQGASLQEMGVYDSDFVYYRTQNGGDDEYPILQIEFNRHDDVVAQLGKKVVQNDSKSDGSALFDVDGSDAALLLYEDCGHAHFARDFEFLNGITSASFLCRNLPEGQSIEGWEILGIDSMEDRIEGQPGYEIVRTKERPEVQPDFEGGDWKPVAVDKLDTTQVGTDMTAVFRTTLKLSQQDFRKGNLELRFGRIDYRGWVFVNGELVGEANDWSKAHVFDVTTKMHVGRNVIAVVVWNEGGGGGLGQPSLVRGARIPADLAYGRPAGIEQQWWKADLDEKEWETIRIDGEIASDEAALTWYRMAFSVQAPKKGVWVPWHLKLNAKGNGFIYLNGHFIGRYWQAGPQYRFFLPECWINFGGDAVNHLAICLRPLDKDVSIQSAVVEPYRDYAEKR